MITRVQTRPYAKPPFGYFSETRSPNKETVTRQFLRLLRFLMQGPLRCRNILAVYSVETAHVRKEKNHLI
jgi:hypothetical protein